ncbi:MCE family protein [Nocardioides humilatus]|uniref:MCE family protein n=1 Tax=Nocardioides humilatus TaxID=2607660 RepID=A0A5B1LFC8_9ACTN|nr:MCE family protein [Nocardioides humilatus]KAA1419343.1 MCE family protein [Nocardioides humilatus]
MTRRGRGVRRTALVVVGVALAASVAGCDLTGGAYDLPLPGGVDVGDRPMTITAEFDDVLDLVPHSSVKVDHVDVGQVAEIELAPDGHGAVVTMEVRGDLGLPADSAARVQQTSLLGEKYVALEPGTSKESLVDGDRIEQLDTSRAVGAEEVLGALSALLNGGGIAQFETISRELEAVGGGRTGEVRAFLAQTGDLMARLDRRRGSITDAIDGLHALSAALDGNRTQIERALTDLTPGIEALSDQRGAMVEMLDALDRLSGVTLDVLDRAGDDIAADLEAIAPVLDQLGRTGRDLPRSLEVLLTFPFTDAVLDAVRGDYLNLYVTLDLRSGGFLAQPDDHWPYETEATPVPLLFGKAPR